jgi:hypothetical protein
MESFRGPQRVWFHFVHSTVKFENRKNKKSSDERNGESDRRGDRNSSFIVNKTRISVYLQLQFNSLHKGVVRLETWIWQIMVLVIIRYRTTRINVRLNAQHRKAMHSNSNQVCRVFSGHSGSTFCSSVMKLADLILFQTSHSPLTIDTETLGLSITQKNCERERERES